MVKYIVKEGKAISTKKGIVGHPKDINNVKQSEFISEKDIPTGQTGLDKLLSLENSPLVEYKPGMVKKEMSKSEKKESKEIK